MANDIQVFRLEEILDIIDLEYVTPGSFEQLNASFPRKIFNVDYMQLEALRQKIGDIGESYVYEREKERLLKAGSKYADRVTREPAKDPRNGYDIKSLTETGEEIYIEVKSTTGDLNTPFYITDNELNTARRIRAGGGIYQIHRVYNVGKEIDVFVYEDESMFNYEETLYRVEIV